MCLTIGPSFAQTPAGPTDTGMVQRSDDDLLLFSLHLDNLILTQELEAYQHPGGVLLPLGEICRLLELAVTVSPSNGTADGFIVRSDRRFHADVRARRVSLAGKEMPFDPSLVELHRNDIYVDARLLNTWLSLGLAVDAHGSSIRVNPHEPLPLQRRLERERRAAQAQAAFSPYRDPGFPRAPNPYTMFGGPAVDQSLSWNLTPANGTAGASMRYTAQIAADIAHLGMNAFIDVEPGHSATAAQFSIGQMDADGNLLGVLHAREVTLGQVYTQAVPLVSDSHLATGLFISNYPLYRSNQFDSTTITGILLPGWDVELYRDQALIDYQGASTTGRYEFKNVPLTFGSNLYRLVFYGPHGERREESRDFNVGDSLIPRGENWYRLSLQPGLNGDTQFTLSDEFGLRGNLSSAVGLATARLSDGIHTYASVGLRGFASGLLSYANLVGDPQTGAAQELGLQWLWKRTTVEAKQTFVSGLVSQTLNSEVNPIREQTLLRFGNIPTPRWTHLLPMDLEAIHEATLMGTDRWQLHNRLSYQAIGISVTNSLTWTSQTSQPSLGQGELLVNLWRHSRLMQGQITYGWAPILQMQQISLQTQKVLHDLRLLSLRVYHSLSDRNYGLTTTLTRTIGSYSYGLSADLSTRHGLSIGLNISMGLLRDPRNGRWDSDAQSRASRGAVLVRAYLDANGNGKRDSGEQGVPGVGFMVNDMGYAKVTGKDGTVLIDGLTQFRPIDLRVSVATLSNPLWMPELTGVRIVPRPGNVPIVEIPIVSTGEISGTVYLKDGTGAREAPGIALELIDRDGHLVQKQTTAYDGFYTFSRVPVGNFRIRVSPTMPERAGSERGGIAVEAPIIIPPDGAFLDGVNLTLP